VTANAQRGIFITFEGPDGSGKTTQIRRLADWLRMHDMEYERNLEPVILRQPGGTALGERIRAILLDSRVEEGLGQIAPLSELALMFADRAQSIRQIILPALDAGRIVLCDRYTDSSEAYQGAGRGLGSDRVLAVHRAICDDLQPDLTILLLPDADAALQRARRRNERHKQQHDGVDENRFEAEGEEFYRRVHAAYAAIAKREPHRVALIDGDDDIETVALRVQAVIANKLGDRVIPPPADV
jgi:dTMP kinase